MPRTALRAMLLPLAAAALGATGCIYEVNHVEFAPLPAQADSVTAATPAKAHLLDGSTVMYRDGVTVARDSLRGAGMRYGRTLADSAAVTLVPRDSVASMEVFSTKVDSEKSWLISGGVTVAFGLLLVWMSNAHGHATTPP